MPSNVQHVPLAQLKPNPDNPRSITPEKFAKLVASLRTFPQMLELRPLVVTADYTVLGGNMRLQACAEAGIDPVPVVVADDLTPEQQREFIIKDNVALGEWEWSALTAEWDTADLQAWGVDNVALFAVAPGGPERDIDLPTMDQSADSYLNNTIRQIVLHYDTDTHADVLARLQRVAQARDIENDNSATVLALLEFWEQQHP